MAVNLDPITLNNYWTIEYIICYKDTMHLYIGAGRFSEHNHTVHRVSTQNIE